GVSDDRHLRRHSLDRHGRLGRRGQARGQRLSADRRDFLLRTGRPGIGPGGRNILRHWRLGLSHGRLGLGRGLSRGRGLHATRLGYRLRRGRRSRRHPGRPARAGHGVRRDRHRRALAARPRLDRNRNRVA
ncbi:MAG: hypothetical protein ACK56I_20850, partial [bacterium]